LTALFAGVTTMDPISIVTASASLVGACAKVSSYIYTFISKAQTVDTAVRVLDIEINSLSQVLGSIATSFSDPLIAREALDSQTGHEGQYWQTVKKSMDDCNGTLAHLTQILEKVGRSDAGNFFRRTNKQVKLSLNAQEIDLLKQKVTAYRRTMQLALQMIAVYIRSTYR
jgi:Fungal N-terminal domain of STAND proteins